MLSPEPIVLQTLQESFEESIDPIVSFLPQLIGAIIILLIGWIIGRVLAGVVRRVAD
ncbi:MAG: mechanosensitive ion channel family protein [Halorhabdus sp.]